MTEQMCGNTLITKQTGETGLPCNCVYVVEKLEIEKEFYLSLTLDRKLDCPVFIYSPSGGMKIEDVAKKNPEQIFKIPIDVTKCLDIEPIIEASKNLDLEDHKS